jgi:outer membrane protein TolC
MRKFLSLFLGWTFLMLTVTPALAQTFPTANYFQQFASLREIPTQLPGPEGLRDYLVDGKLRLNLNEAIRLTLLNSTEVRMNQLEYESTRFAIQRAYQPFDPILNSNFGASRQTVPTYSQLKSGMPTYSDLSHQFLVGYNQTFQTGTQYNVNFSSSRDSSNSIFATFNPSIYSSLNFSFTQPLLRNRGLFPNRAPIVIAQRNLKQSRSQFEASVNLSIARAVDQYWAVVQARESLKVLQKSLELAEVTYRQNKRALELGALPPLDIYRSESQVASRRVGVIQAEYDLKQSEDELRRTIGADLDPYFRVIDIELTEPVNAVGELLTVETQAALDQALGHRPELEALRQQLANDDMSIQLAHHRLQPELNLTGFYSSNGLGGNQIDTTTVPPTVIAQGGFGDSLSQIGSFDFPSYGFNVQLNLPVKNRAVEADLGNALVSKRRSLYVMRQLEQEIGLEVRRAAHLLEQAKLSMAAARIARDLSQKNLEAEQRKYELGAQPIFFTLEAQTQLAQDEQNLVRSEIGYQRSIAALDRATASLLDRHRIQIAEPVRESLR